MNQSLRRQKQVKKIYCPNYSSNTKRPPEKVGIQKVTEPFFKILRKAVQSISTGSTRQTKGPKHYESVLSKFLYASS